MSVRKKLANFVAINGWYVFGLELISRSATNLRSYLYSRILRAPGLRIGANPYVRGVSFISIGAGFHAGESLWLEALSKYHDQEFFPSIVIHENVSISNWTHIAATHYVEIGANVLLGSKVMITDHNHGQYSRVHTSPHVAPSLRNLDHDRSVVIGRNVWLGDGVVVTPGSSIGEGAVIGSNSVVRGNIPPFTISAGVPARVLKIFNFKLQEWINVE